METIIEDLPSSRLGTFDYWEALYQTELGNYDDNPEDHGEVWFGKRVESKLAMFIEENFSKTSSILDIGCGNGHFVKRLCETGFTQLTGIDYSESAIRLAQKICNSATFRQCDILDESQTLASKFDLIFDKGTFDAICLIPSHEECKSYLLAGRYSKFIEKCLHSHTKLIITSCNWTRDELVKLFSMNWIPDDSFPPIEHSTLRFGNSQGQNVTSIVFKKK